MMKLPTVYFDVVGKIVFGYMYGTVKLFVTKIAKGNKISFTLLEGIQHIFLEI
jgi:hypothetical protein